MVAAEVAILSSLFTDGSVVDHYRLLSIIKPLSFNSNFLAAVKNEDEVFHYHHSTSSFAWIKDKITDIYI